MISYKETAHSEQKRSIWFHIHLDLPLLAALLILMSVGLFVIYSAGGQDLELVQRQVVRLGIGIGVMFVVAQFNPLSYQRWLLPAFIVGIALLVAVLVVGHVGKGAQRWLDLGFFMFQPSEVMKLFVPLVVAWYIARQPLPSRKRELAVGALLVLLPTLLIARQPDLGTSLLVAASGIFVLFLAGASWRLIGLFAAAISAFTPVLWFYLMRDYQRQRVLTLFNPEREPLGSGYHIIQSKIAIGSGGLFGKGWMQGTQSQLEFLPERHTDFIFAVFAEEFGLVGIALLLSLYLFIIARGLVIAANAQQAFTRLLAGSLTLTFFVYVFVNIGMVSGLLPVVGIPLPLISYGGTSMVTLMAAFGILMAIQTHRRLIAT